MSHEEADSKDPRLSSTEHIPWLYRDTKINHYYGDITRQCLVIAAALVLLTAPFYADDLHAELPFEILGAVVLVGLAGATNPWNRVITMSNAVASGAGLVIFETWALQEYDASNLIVFVLKQVIAFVFLCAFYFSIKTLRAMLMGKVNQQDRTSAEEVQVAEEPDRDDDDELKEPSNDAEEEVLEKRRKKWHETAILERREYDG